MTKGQSQPGARANYSILSVLFVFFLTGNVASAEQGSMPPSFDATYSVVASGLKLGKLYVSLEVDTDGYRYTKETRAFGLLKLLRNDHIKESSSGLLDSTGLPIPQRYSFDHSNKKERREEQMNWKKLGVTGSWKGEQYKFGAVQGEQDPASQDLALIYSLSSESRNTVNIPVVEKGKQKTHRYRVEGREEIVTKAGHFDAIHLLLERKNSTRKTELWLAPDLHYIPIKITHKDRPDSPAVITELTKVSWK